MKNNVSRQASFQFYACPCLQTALLIFSHVSCAALDAITEFSTFSYFSTATCLGMASQGREQGTSGSCRQCLPNKDLCFSTAAGFGYELGETRTIARKEYCSLFIDRNQGTEGIHVNPAQVHEGMQTFGSYLCTSLSSPSFEHFSPRGSGSQRHTIPSHWQCLAEPRRSPEVLLGPESRVKRPPSERLAVPGSSHETASQQLHSEQQSKLAERVQGRTACVRHEEAVALNRTWRKHSKVCGKTAEDWPDPAAGPELSRMKA